MSTMFTMLQRQSAFSGYGKLPEWQSTHPDPENRVAKNDERVGAFPGDPDTLRTIRDGFLHAMDGLIFGEDPRQGFFDGATFNHPDLKFTMRFPEGWATRNQPDAVVASSPEGDAVGALNFAAESSTRTALAAFLGQSGVQTVRQTTSAVNGLPGAAAEFVAVIDQNRLQGMVQFIEYGGRVYRLLGYTGASTFGRYRNVLSQYTTSFSRLTDRAALDRQPVHLSLVTLPRSMTIEAFNQAYPSTIEIERLAIINGVQLGETMPGGRLVKRVR
jgi:predicted Zn-dependent protease